MTSFKLTAAHPRRLALGLALLTTLLPAAAATASSGGVGPGGDTSSGTIEGLSGSYARFVQLVSGQTDLSLKVLAAWTVAEGGPRDNPLNIGPGNDYGSIRGGARATSNLLHDERYAEVLASAGTSDRRQIRAIADSPWCPGCTGYQRLLKRTYEGLGSP